MIYILFLCSKNACRSQMAEGFARARAISGVEIQSAGTEATLVHPMAIRVMREAGVDISSQRSKALEDLDSPNFDLVITLCDQAAESCPFFPGNPVRVDWSLPNPDAVNGSEEEILAAFRDCRDAIKTAVDNLFDRGYVKALTGFKQCEDLILENISDGIVAHDMGRRIFCFNTAAEEITGFERNEVLGRDCHDVFPGGLCGGKCLFTDGVPENPIRVREEATINTKDGEDRLVEITSKPMTNGDNTPVGMLVSFRDRTREHDLARRAGEAEQYSGMIGKDAKMLDIFDLIREVAGAKAPVLIQGESGTGKELVAAAIHAEGERAGNRFVPVNCGALPESLLESELFGHVKGAFTGAIRDKKGRFELADGGTIFLDEIGDISPAVQVKLLRVLQEGRFERVGSEDTIESDVRIISATNRDLQEEVASGRFREDLFYRLNVVPIFLPPLRDRRTDIPLLVRNELDRIGEERGKTNLSVAPETMDIMVSYDWPGNVRELQNWLEFALIKCRNGLILPEHLPPQAGVADDGKGRRMRRRKLDTRSVRKALEEADGNKVEAAKALGVSRATLYRFLDDFDI